MLSFVATEMIGKNQYQITCCMNDDGTVTSFECRDMDYLRGKTLAEILKAIRKKEHDDKRGFLNPKAYMISSGYNEAEKVREVTVTSVRDSRTVWVSYGGGKRGTEGLHRLYASRELLQDALDFKKEINSKLASKFAVVPMWKPEHKEEKS